MFCASLILATEVASADVDPFTSHAQSATSLVMPFDVSSPAASTRLLVSYSHGLAYSNGLMSAHWSFWSKNGAHLADFSTCLRKGDTTVVDPRHFQELGANNEAIGPIIDLSGYRGFVTVTAYLTNASCQVGASTGFVLGHSLTGSFSINKSDTGISLTHDAIGLQASDGVVNLPAGLFTGGPNTGGVEIQTLDPSTLGSSYVVLLALQEQSGSGAWTKEVGPMTQKVSAEVTFYDDDAVPTSLPNIAFKAASFTAVGPSDAALIPSTVEAMSPGFLRLGNFSYGATDKRLKDKRWVYAFIGESVGAATHQSMGKYVFLGDDARLVRYRNEVDCLPGFGFVSSLKAGDIVWRSSTGTTSDYLIVNDSALGPFVETGCGNLVFNYAALGTPLTAGRRYLLRQTSGSHLVLSDEGAIQ